MSILKSLSRKILAEELEKEHERNLKRIEDVSEDKELFREKVSKLENENGNLRCEMAEIKVELTGSKKRVEELEKENAMLREYYKLDEEPSEDIQLKIHINLEINRLKEELQKQQLMQIANIQQVGQYQMAQYAMSSASYYNMIMRRF